MKEMDKKLKLVIIERDRNGNQIGRTEIPVNNKPNTIVNRIQNKPNYDYRRTFESIIRDNQRRIILYKKKIELILHVKYIRWR